MVKMFGVVNHLELSSVFRKGRLPVLSAPLLLILRSVNADFSLTMALN